MKRAKRLMRFSQVFYFQQLGNKFKTKNSMEENISKGRSKQLLRYPVYLNMLCEKVIDCKCHVLIFTLWYFSVGGCRSSSEDGSHGSAHTSAERQRNQGPAHHQRKRNQSDRY